jgi:hypothetical protein
VEVFSMLAQVRRYLDEYQEKYRRPGLPGLELRGMYALFPEEGVPDFVESRWNDPYPNADRKGVYLIFARTGLLLFIGRASMGASIGGRLGTYFAGKKECRLLSTDWTERPAYIATIAVPQGMSFEAPALEEYLIRCLNPCDNSLGTRGQLPVGGVLPLEAPAIGQEEKPTASSAVPLGPGVYTYSAPGMPMCPTCGQRPGIFYCSTHQSLVCLECVAKHDVRGECAYLPAFRAPRPAPEQVTTSGPAQPPGTGKPKSILGI